jgi:hypothetical protein
MFGSRGSVVLHAAQISLTGTGSTHKRRTKTHKDTGTTFLSHDRLNDLHLN